MKAFFGNFQFLPIILLFAFVNTYAQKEFDAKEFFIEAESYFLFEEYSDALPLYQRILSVEPENSNVKYKIGVCYLNDPYQKERSVKYLKEASENTTPKYKTNNYKEKLAPIDALYYLGQAYRVTGELDKAIKSYNDFKAVVDPEVYNMDVVNAELASCQSAKNYLKSPVFSKLKNMGDVINTRFSEINAVISGDGKTIVYTRELQFYDATFISTLDENGVWSPPYNLTPDFGLDGNSYATGISYKGDEILVYRSDNFDGNIYSSKKVDGVWQKLEALNVNINTKYWESHASLSPDGQELYFTSNRKGGYGGLDIYRSTKDAKGEWGVPVNLGPIVNSAFNEDTPFISPSTNRLYFSSLGHDGMGGYDIFITEKVGPGKWSRPINMGYPFNTTDDDLFFCPLSMDNYAGIRSVYDEESSYGLKDVYWIEVYNEVLPRNFSVTGQVNAPAPELLKGDNLTVSLIDNEAGKIVSQASIDSSGSFNLSAPQGEYQLLVDGEGIKPVSVPVSLDVNQESEVVDLALITAIAAAVGEDVMAVPPSGVSEIIVIGDDYLMVETAPVVIGLEVEPNSELKIETFAGNTLVQTEEYHLSKDKFTYKLIPAEGENKVVFTMTDSRGNTSTKEVVVYYTPIAEPIAETVEVKNIDVETALPGVALLASAGLQQYLIGLGDVSFDSKDELYEVLVANAEAQDYTVDEVNELFSVLLTQRDKEEFLSAINQTDEFDDLRLSDSLLDELDYPKVIVTETKREYGQKLPQVNSGLAGVVPYSGVSSAKLAYILSFAGISISEAIDADPKTNIETVAALNNFASQYEVDSALELAATTQELEYYYQNLLYNSEGQFKELLLSVKPQHGGINNSINLVSYLLATAPEYGLTAVEVIQVIDKAQLQQEESLSGFKESLASAATGQLKTDIENLDMEGLSSQDFESIINDLLRQSKTSGYSALEVYELLLSLLGVEKVDELADLMGESSSTAQLDSLIAEIELEQFSKPVEVIQYLLSQSPYFDYTDSDINNMLLRLLLEKGMDSYQQSEEVMHAEKLIKRRKTITTIVLANVLLILLFIIFRRRSQKK